MVDESSYLDNDNSNPLKRFLSKAWPEADMEAKAWIVEDELREIYKTGFLLPRDEETGSIPTRDRDLSYQERLREVCTGLRQEKTTVVDIMQDDPKLYGFLNAPTSHRNKKASNRDSNDKRALKFGTKRQPRNGSGVQKKSAGVQKDEGVTTQQNTAVVPQVPSCRHVDGSDQLGQRLSSLLPLSREQQAGEVPLSSEPNVSSLRVQTTTGSAVFAGSDVREGAPSVPAGDAQMATTEPSSDIPACHTGEFTPQIADTARPHGSHQSSTAVTLSSLAFEHANSITRLMGIGHSLQPPQNTVSSTMRASRKRSADTTDPQADAHASKKQCIGSIASEHMSMANMLPFNVHGRDRSPIGSELGPPRPMAPLRRFVSQPWFEAPGSLQSR